MTCNREVEQAEEIENAERKYAEQRAHIELLLERASLSHKDLSYAFDRVIKILEYSLD